MTIVGVVKNFTFLAALAAVTAAGPLFSDSGQALAAESLDVPDAAPVAAGGSVAAPHHSVQIDPGKGAVGPVPSHCLKLPGRPDLVVRAVHLKNSKGTVRFVLYGDNPDDFLAKGKRLARIEVPAREGASVCISLPKPGNYALAILHDINGNGKFNLAADGGGFSNNPKLMFSRPSYEETAFPVPQDGAELDIRMRYLSGGK